MSLSIQLQQQVAELEQAILSAHPTLPTLLQQIHRNLKADPEAVTLLSEEQIGVIVNGLSRQTQTAIATSISTKKSGKASSKLTLDDF